MQTPKNILSHKRFRRLTQQMDHLARFNDALAPCLPNHLVGHVYAASAIPPTLVLHTAHSGFATELRFRASEILERIRFITEYTTFTQLKIKVMTDVIEPRQRIGKPNRINKNSSDTLSNMAENIDDPKLKAALQRLSRRQTEK